MDNIGKLIRNGVELALLLIVAAVSVIIPLLDFTGAIDADPWIARRIPTLTLLCVGFLASYLIVERRGKLDQIASMLDERSMSILRAVGAEVEEYATSGDWADAVATRIKKAKRVDDVSWTDEKDIQFRWSQSDRAAHQRNDAMTKQVIRDPKVTWREIYIFHPSKKHSFEMERKNILDPKATGYSLAFFDVPSAVTPPRIGGFLVVDAGTEQGEVFITNSDSTQWLRIRQPAIVQYYSNYFDSLWNKAKKAKVGRAIDKQLLAELEANLTKVP